MIDFKLNNPTGTEYEIKSTPIWFGQVVRKYQLPKALVNRLNEEIDLDLKDKILKVKDKILRMAYNPDEYVKDINSVYELKKSVATEE